MGVDFRTLYKVAKDMGITEFEKICIYEETREKLKNDGLPLDNIQFTPEGLAYSLDEKGNRYHITIHIKNHKFFGLFYLTNWTQSFLSGRKFGDSFSTPRVIHLSKCKTINNMIERKELWKYHKSQIENHLRSVLTSRDEEEIELFVCQNCITELGIKSSYPEADLIKNNFGFKEFFEEHESKFDPRSSKSERVPADDYPPNWAEIAREYKESMSWTCECCRVKLQNGGLLDCHHKNKKKADVRFKNLLALCKECHAHAPYHSHMKRNDETIRYIRVEQNLPAECEKCKSSILLSRKAR